MSTIIDNALNLIGVRPRRNAKASTHQLRKEIEEARARGLRASKEAEVAFERARLLIEELEAEAKWDDAFARTTDAQLDKMLENAKRDVAENGTISLAELKASL